MSLLCWLLGHRWGNATFTRGDRGIEEERLEGRACLFCRAFVARIDREGR